MPKSCILIDGEALHGLKGRHGGEGAEGSADFQVYEVDYTKGMQYERPTATKNQQVLVTRGETGRK